MADMGAGGPAKTRRLYVSGYNHSAEDPGILVFDVAADGSSAAPAGESAGVASPSFLRRSGSHMYACGETPEAGGLAVYAMDADGIPACIGQIRFSGAAGTCFALPHPAGGCLYGADYNSGSVCRCALGDRGGELKPPVALIQHGGHGAPRAKGDPNFSRQLSPHVHTLSFVPGTSLLAAVDLGLDLIALYETDDAGSIVDAGRSPVMNLWPDGLSGNGRFASRTGCGDASDEAAGGAAGEAGVRAGEAERGGDDAPGTAEAPYPTPSAPTDTLCEERAASVGADACRVRIRRIRQDGAGAAVADLPVRPAAVVQAPLYAGPRIIAYHPHQPVAALICELGCELILFRIEQGGLRWTPFARIDLLEDAPRYRTSAQPPLSAHCAFSADGRFLYASTRGTDRLAVFALDEQSNPVPVFDCPCGGATPRHFALSPDGGLLAVANQTGGNVSLFRRNADTGTLVEALSIPCTVNPSCIVWGQ